MFLPSKHLGEFFWSYKRWELSIIWLVLSKHIWISISDILEVTWDWGLLGVKLFCEFHVASESCKLQAASWNVRVASCDFLIDISLYWDLGAWTHLHSSTFYIFKKQIFKIFTTHKINLQLAPFNSQVAKSTRTFQLATCTIQLAACNLHIIQTRTEEWHFRISRHLTWESIMDTICEIITRPK